MAERQQLSQFVVTPAAGKRLIALAMASYEPVLAALKKGAVVVVAGTTNGYVAEELLRAVGQAKGFSRRRFFRGITLPPAGVKRTPDESGFPGDVVIRHGQWLAGKTIFDVVDDLREGDVVLKGANAVDLRRGRAAVLIGHPKGGTIIAALQAAVGRRARLILPVGVEKRVTGDLFELAARLNAPGASGARLLPAPGEIITELEALNILAGVRSEIVAAGGVCGAEGAVWLAVSGSAARVRQAAKFLAAAAKEPPFAL